MRYAILAIGLFAQWWTVNLFFKKLETTWSSDGYIGYGLLYWAMVGAYVITDVVWISVLIWKAVH